MVSKKTSVRKTQKKSAGVAAKRTGGQKNAAKTVKPTVQNTRSVAGSTTSTVSLERRTKRITIFPASWDINEQRQFVSFIFGMILAGFIMWGYVVLDNHKKEEEHKKRLQFSMEMWARKAPHKFRRGHRLPPPCMVGKPRKAAFNPAEYAPYAQKGKLDLSGSVCAGLPAGAVCPHKVMVFVNPVTGYSTEWYTRHWVKNEPLAAPDQRAWQFQRRSISGDKGMFVLKDLPAGAYYVGANMCVKLKPTDSGCTPMRLGAKVKLNKNETVALKTVFTGNMLPPPVPCPCDQNGGCKRK